MSFNQLSEPFARQYIELSAFEDAVRQVCDHNGWYIYLSNNPNGEQFDRRKWVIPRGVNVIELHKYLLQHVYGKVPHNRDHVGRHGDNILSMLLFGGHCHAPVRQKFFPQWRPHERYEVMWFYDQIALSRGWKRYSVFVCPINEDVIGFLNESDTIWTERETDIVGVCDDDFKTADILKRTQYLEVYGTHAQATPECTEYLCIF